MSADLLDRMYTSTLDMDNFPRMKAERAASVEDTLEAINIIRLQESQIALLKEQKADAESILDAWFDRRKLAHTEIDNAVLGAVAGYLSVCRNGGMPKEDSDFIFSVVKDMTRHAVFADLFARFKIEGSS